MKLFKRSPIIFNFILFLLMSHMYLYVLTSLNKGESSFEISRFLIYFTEEIFLNALLLLSIVTIYWVKRWSKFFIVIFLLVVLSQEMSIFFYKFDKIILILVSIHILISFYYYLLWGMELEDVVYCPGFSKYDCGKKYYYEFESEVELSNGVILPAKLTNWDRRGIFCLINESDGIVAKKVLIRIKFENEVFEQRGRIISSYNKGYGIKFIKEKTRKSVWGWRDFYTIIRDRGYTPNYVRA